MPPVSDEARLDAAVSRLPYWLLGLGAAGAAAAAWRFGLSTAGGFLLGAVASWLNLRMMIGAVDKIGAAVKRGDGLHRVRPRRRSAIILIRLTLVVLGAFVILKASGFSVGAVLCGFFVCPAAVLAEILHELVKYEHS